VRIAELYLKAYGPFTERRIDLSASAHRMHVIFGRNEAGKSSALRALQHLLYGIPARSSDDFVHDYARMRIGARIRRSDGRELAFLRKKGNRNTLRSWDDTETLADAELEPFLQGVPRELFTRFFGIDHAVLAAGGQGLLDDDGEVGRSLFAAGLGSADLRGTLDDLDAEAADLFKPSGSRPRINAAIVELRDVRARIKSDSLKGRDWKEHDRTLEETERELAAIAAQLSERRAEHTRLVRLRSALPFLGRRRGHREALREMGEVVPLEDGFEEHLHGALARRSGALEGRAESARTLQQLATSLEALQLDAGFLEHREAVDLFREKLGSYKTSREHLPRRQGERARLGMELEAELSAVRPDLGVDRLDELYAPLARRRLIQELANEHSALRERVETATRALRRGTQERERAHRELLELPAARDASALRRALEAARRQGDVDAQLHAATLRCDRSAAECRNALQALGSWSGTLEALVCLPVPELETIERFDGEAEALRKERERALERTEGIERQLRDVDAQLVALRRGGAVPTEAELGGERERRDAGWGLVRRRWIEGEAIDDEIAAFTGDSALADVYERSVAAADEVADRLRREADRVASQAELSAQRERLAADADEVGGALAALEKRERDLVERWRGVWLACDIDPFTPREMIAWLRRQQQLVADAADARTEADTLLGLQDMRDAHRGDLRVMLAAIGEPCHLEGADLAPVLTFADQAVQSIEAVEGRRGELESIVEERDAALLEARTTADQAQERLGAWHEEWRAAIEGLGVDEKSRPVGALDGLDALAALFDKRREIDRLDERIEGMRQEARDFEDAVGDFVRTHAPDLESQPVEQQVPRLGRMISDVEKEQTLRAQLRSQVSEQERRAAMAERALEEAESELARLRAEACCSDDAGLEEAVRRWRDQQSTRSKLRDLEAQLLEMGAGATIEQLESQSAHVDADALPGQIQALHDEIDALEIRRTELMSRRAAARSELDRMDGSARTAQAAEQAQEILAKLRRDVERYVRVRLARTILQREIERYRGEHQAPLVVRASELFRELTLGSFVGLQTHYDDDDRPQLVGVREDQRPVGVAGMSSGTRDQLFLALRLATLEEYLERSEPMPFVVDDILVNFDDERARATLEVLARLGERTQVLLFTHHGRIREQARALGPAADVGVIDLDAG
jgi:uncharacterized protein YhaN